MTWETFIDSLEVGDTLLFAGKDLYQTLKIEDYFIDVICLADGQISRGYGIGRRFEVTPLWTNLGKIDATESML